MVAAAGEALDQALLAALHQPVIATDAEGQVVAFSAGAAALFGSERLQGRSIRHVLPFVDPPASLAEDQAAWQGSVGSATDRAVDVDVSVTVLGQGPRAGLGIYMVHDVSRHVELNRLREELLYSVAHELRAPLTALDWGLEILSSDYQSLPAEERAHLLASTRRTAQRVRTLMEDLLSAGSIKAGRFLVSPRSTPLAAVVEEAVDSVDAMVTARGQRIAVQMPAEPVYLYADPRGIRQVLRNLLSNASKYSPRNGVIRLTVEQQAGGVEVSVEDRGRGIPPEERAGLFERFYRVRSGSEAPGIGLGLAIVKGIVEAHGGTISLESELGVGTTIRFTLPAAPEPAQAAPAETEEPLVL